MRRIRKRKNSGLPMMWWFLLAMLVVCVLLIIVMWPRGKKKELETEHIPGNTGVPSVTVSALPAGWDKVPDAEDSAVIRSLGSRVIFFEKKNDMKVEVAEDDYVHRTITVKVRGLKTQSFSSDSLKCVFDGTYLAGKNAILNGMSGVLNDWELTVAPADGGGYEATIVFSEKSIYECRIAEDENYVFLDFYRPKELYDTVILIDAGHGTPDPGTTGADGTREKDLVLAYTLALKELTDKQSRAKFYFTRLEDSRLDEDYSTDLHMRPEIANELDADLFLSIHMNAHDKSSYSGTQAYYNETQNDWQTFHSKTFAQILLPKVANALEIKALGSFPAAELYTVVKESKVPVVLLETAYLSNEGDLAAVTDPARQQAAVQAIYDALMEAVGEIEADRQAGTPRYPSPTPEPVSPTGPTN